MSSKEFPNYNDSRKSVISSSNHNQRNQKEKISTSRKVSFFNQAQNQAKNSNNRYYADISRNINEEDSDEIDSNLSSDSYDEDREKLNWLKRKIDWLDPFIDYEDELLIDEDKQNLVFPESEKDYNRTSYSSYNSYSAMPPRFSFWNNPFRRK